MKFLPTLTLWASALLPLASASGSGLAVRNAPGTSTHDTIAAVARALRLMSRQEEKTLFENSTYIERSYQNATLLKVSGEVPFQTRAGNGTVEAGIELVCTTCYFVTNVSASLTIESDVDWSGALGNFTDAVLDEFNNVTDVVVNWIDQTTDSAFKSLFAIFDFDDDTDVADVDFPTLDVDFNIDIPDGLLPETNLKIQFDGLEIYLEMDMTINAGVTYTIPILPPGIQPMGLGKSTDLFVGAVMAVELILSAEGEIELSTGVHIQLDDNVSLEIALFGKNITNSNFPGGSVEFLPVTVRSASVTLSAILQVSVHTGFALDIPHVPDWLEDFLPSAGVEAFMFANIAEFTTNIESENEDTDGDGCLLNIVQDFKFAVGAGAGATVELAGETWGPNPETTIEVWTTTIADICGNSASPTPTVTTTTVEKRQEGMSTATKETTLAYTGVVCMSSLKQCPASLQKHTVATSVTTLTSILPSGEVPVWPTTAANAINQKIAFGSRVEKLFAASGTPTPGIGNDDDSFIDTAIDKINGVDKRIVIGVSVGVGGFALLLIAGVVAFCIRKKRRAAAPVMAREPFIPPGRTPTTQVVDSGYYGADYGSGGYGAPLPSPGVSKDNVNVTYTGR